MRSTQQFSITLPNEMSNLVESKIVAGGYATESEVIRGGLLTLITHDRAVEAWLRNQVGQAHDALSADPSRALTVDQVRTTLAVRRKARA